MLNLRRDILPLTDFKRNTTNVIRQMKRSKHPVVLTVNGKASMVVQDADSYQELLDQLERLEVIEAIRVGMRDEEAGRVRPALKALREMKARVDVLR